MKTRHLTKTLGHYEIQGARAVDGDTVEAVVLLPFGTMAVKRIRLAGWWAPELDGLDHAGAIQAKESLQRFLDANVCTIFSRSERQDKYGRVIASLWASGKPVEPGAVLGLFALTETQHKADSDWKHKHPHTAQFLATEGASHGMGPKAPQGESWLDSRPSISAAEASAYDMPDGQAQNPPAGETR